MKVDQAGASIGRTSCRSASTGPALGLATKTESGLRWSMNGEDEEGLAIPPWSGAPGLVAEAGA